MKFEVVFTCKQVLRVFKEVVEATDTEEAKKVVSQMVVDAGLKLDHITAVIQIN